MAAPFLMGLTTKTPFPWIGDVLTAMRDRSTLGAANFFCSFGIKRLGYVQLVHFFR